MVWIDNGRSQWVIIDERLEERVGKKSRLEIPRTESSCEKSRKMDFASGEDENGSIDRQNFSSKL